MDQKPVSYRWNLCKESSFQSRKNQWISFDLKVDFLLVWTALTSLIFGILLKLLVFFIWCLEIIMSSYVKSYFLLWVLPTKRIKALRQRRSWNVLKSFPQFLLKRFFSIGFCLMNDVKLLQPCACVENFYGNWRIISCLIAWLS